MRQRARHRRRLWSVRGVGLVLQQQPASWPFMSVVFCSAVRVCVRAQVEAKRSPAKSSGETSAAASPRKGEVETVAETVAAPALAPASEGGAALAGSPAKGKRGKRKAKAATPGGHTRAPSCPPTALMGVCLGGFLLRRFQRRERL